MSAVNGPHAAAPFTTRSDMARRLDARAADFAAAFDALLNAKREVEEDVTAAVRSIVADVCARGDAALVELTERFDRVRPASLRLDPAEIEAAEAQCSQESLKALDTAARRIEAYHRRQLPKDESFTDETGATLGWRWTPLDS